MEEELDNQYSRVGIQFRRMINAFNFCRFDDIMVLIRPLTEIKVKDGYLIDAFMVGDFHGSRFQLYAERADANEQYVPYKIVKKNFFSPKKKVLQPFKDGQYVVGMLDYDAYKQIPSVYDYIEYPNTEMGFWQSFLLHNASTMMPRDWHDIHGHRDYIFSLYDLDNISSVDCSDYRNNNILPSVKIENGKAIVTCYFWNSWRGLCRETATIDVETHMGRVDIKIMIPYHCGIIF
jgi:hypothetical protein